jgi:hypothetical protein
MKPDTNKSILGGVTSLFLIVPMFFLFQLGFTCYRESMVDKLSWAVWDGDEAKVRALIARGADPNSKGFCERTESAVATAVKWETEIW